jgi:PAS domain S-box-containing protein
VSSHQAPPNPAELDAHLRDVLEAVPEAILEVDAAGHILLVDVAAEQMFGYNRQEFLTLNVDALVPTTRRNIHARPRLGYAHQPERRPIGTGLELEAQRRDGFLFPVEITLSPNHSVENLTVIVSVRDITDRKQAERALRESEAKFPSISVGWTYTGLALEESYGMGWNTPLHPEDKQRAWDAWNHAVATGEPYRVEIRLRAADDSYRWFLMQSKQASCQGKVEMSPRWQSRNVPFSPGA